MRNWSVETRSPEETRALGFSLGASVEGSAVILLSGDLGAGKTCLAQGFARGLGIPSDEAVTSPTFTLMNHYRGRLDLYHFDLYRLSDYDDLVELGFEEVAEGEGVTVVEWADRFDLGFLQGLRVDLQHLEGRRHITFSAEGSQSEELLGRLSKRWKTRKEEA